MRTAKPGKNIARYHGRVNINTKIRKLPHHPSHFFSRRIRYCLFFETIFIDNTDGPRRLEAKFLPIKSTSVTLSSHSNMIFIFFWISAIRASQRLYKNSGIYFEERQDVLLKTENTITLPILSPVTINVKEGKKQAETISMIQVCSKIFRNFFGQVLKLTDLQLFNLFFEYRGCTQVGQIFLGNFLAKYPSLKNRPTWVQPL